MQQKFHRESTKEMGPQDPPIETLSLKRSFMESGKIGDRGNCLFNFLVYLLENNLQHIYLIQIIKNVNINQQNF